MQFVTEKWPILLNFICTLCAKQLMDHVVQSAPPPFLDFLAADFMFQVTFCCMETKQAGQAATHHVLWH